MKLCLCKGTRSFWAKKTAGFCQEPDDSYLQSELCPITSKQRVLWACFVLKWAIVFHFPTINMHRTANEAEPTKIIRFWGCSTTDCINGVWLCGEAFVSGCLWTAARNGSLKEMCSMAHGLNEVLISILQLLPRWNAPAERAFIQWDYTLTTLISSFSTF